MRKIVLYSLASVLLATSNLTASIGLAYAKGDDNSKNITTFVSYNIFARVNLRLEYNRNLSKYKEFFSTKINRYGLFATYTQALGNYFSITPKVGIVKTNGDFQTLNTLKTISDSSTDFTYGVELNYDLNSALSIFAGYTDYGHKFKKIKDIKASKINSKNISIGLKLNFF